MTEFRVCTTGSYKEPYNSLVIESNDMKDDVWQLEHTREYGRQAFSIEISYETAERLVAMINQEVKAAHGRAAWRASERKQ